MTPVMEFNGIYTPVVTPFHADHTPDFGALALVIERLIGAGVHGLITGGSTGENYAMTVDERLAVARETVRLVAGRVPVIMGTGAMLPADMMSLAMGGKEMGADALLVATPLMLAHGLFAVMIGPGPALTLVGFVWLLVFLWVWSGNLREVGWGRP